MRSRVMAFLSAIDGALLLRFANKDDTFVLSKSGAPLVGDIVFALPFCERDHRNLIVLGISLDGFHEMTGDRLDHRGRSHRMSAVNAYELQNPFHRLQHRHVDVEVHPVDAFQFEHYMVTQYFRHALRCSGFRLPTWFATHSPSYKSKLRGPHSHTRRSEAEPRWCPVIEVGDITGGGADELVCAGPPGPALHCPREVGPASAPAAVQGDGPTSSDPHLARFL